METEELIKLVDGIYKNILDKFNPGARQMINAGKAYLKALHGAAAASRLYVDAINKLARQAQQGTWGGCSDVGTALMKIVEVYKEIQDQQMNILKAFYVDLLVPLETNLEKDTKVVQSEQKRFLQQHKQRAETYSKAAAMMKKQRKKSRSSTKTGLVMDKELKNMQALEEEKTKLDAFCEQSLKNALTQERRRYGFVLERQCSLAKHYLSYHTFGVNTYQQNLDKWSEVAKTREFLPESVENIFTNRLRQISVWHDEDMYSNPRSPRFDDDRISISSQLRKTKSMDASCLDVRSLGEVGSPVTTLSRAKSEYNLNSSTHSLEQDETPKRRPKSMAVPPVPPPQWDTQLARALYAYLSSGDNQLSFLEGDLIALIGERSKGWQFGENLRTQTSGWFPLAYTEVLDDSSTSPSHASSSGTTTINNTNNSNMSTAHPMSPSSGSGKSGNPPDAPASGTNNPDTLTPRMFGDTLHLHRSTTNSKQIRRAVGSNNIPPPALPAPVPTPSLPYHRSGMSQSQSTNFGSNTNGAADTSTFQSPYPTSGIKASVSTFNFPTGTTTGPYSTHPQPSRSDRPTAGAPLPLHLQTKGAKISGGPVGNVSLHSSNDSGFSNDPPPQPEIDYSDDDSIPGQTKLPARNARKHHEISKGRKSAGVRQSRSAGNLIDRHYYISDSEYMSTAERRGLVKRTKSFWRFGRNSSDNEILEGMSLWRHRDLVDVEDEERPAREPHTAAPEPEKRKRKPARSRDASNDSDRTLLNVAEVAEEVRPPPAPVKQENGYEKAKKAPTAPNANPSPPDQFYDDSGDGLLMRTVNRKSILQQYTNDSTGPDSESESEVTSDDPYDCIVVDDQAQAVRGGGGTTDHQHHQQQKQQQQQPFPNVAALGRKLEKLSKNAKYTPGKEMGEKSIVQMRNERNKTMEGGNNKSKAKSTQVAMDSEEFHRDQMRASAFKTFGNGQDVNGGEHKAQRNRNNDTGGKEKQQQQQRRYYEREVNGAQDRKPRPSYDSMDSQLDQHRDRRAIKDKEREKVKYYREPTTTTTADELSDATTTQGDTNRPFLPRTKLVARTNSAAPKQSKYAQDTTTDQGSLTDYGETLQRRLNAMKMDEKSQQRNGNMYGPWMTNNFATIKLRKGSKSADRSTTLIIE